MMPTRHVSKARFPKLIHGERLDKWGTQMGHKWGTNGAHMRHTWYNMTYIYVCDMNSYSAVLAVLGSNEQGPWKSVSVQLSRSVAVAGVKACKEHSRAMGRPAV